MEYRLPPCARRDVKAAVAAATLNLNDKDGMRNLPPEHYPRHYAVLCIHDEGRSGTLCPAGDRLYRRSGPSERQRFQNANTMQSMDIMNKPYRRIELAERVRAALAKSTGRKPNDPAYFRHEG